MRNNHSANNPDDPGGNCSARVRAEPTAIRYTHLMPMYRRAHSAGGTFFFTLVTHRRQRFLCDDIARDLLHHAIDVCRARHRFTIDGFVLLPDHLHTIWTLPEGDSDFSLRWNLIKKTFTQTWLSAGGGERSVTDSKIRDRRRGVWQRRFWEHLIRDPDDLHAHLDYIHYNPVKHGLVRCVHDWQWSSFHAAVRKNQYDPRWACSCEDNLIDDPLIERMNQIDQRCEMGE